MNELNFIIINKFAVLIFILLFFVVLFSLNKFGKKRISLTSVSLTIKLALAGIILLLFSVELKDIPIYGKTAHIIQNLITLLCVANFFRYILIELFLNLKWKGEPPSFLKTVFSLLIYLLFGIISLRLVFNIELASVITTSAILTAAIAFAMQNALANIVSGFSIQLDKNLKKGNWIYIKEKDIYGKIVNIGLRYITLKTLEDTYYIIPNTQALQSSINVLEEEKSDKSFALYTTVGLRYEIPPEKSKDIIRRVILNHKNIAKTPEPKVYLNRYADSSIEYKIKFYINDYILKDATIDSIHSQIWYSVIREGYDFPYPHREIIQKSHTTEKIEPINIQPYLDRCFIFSSLDPDQKIFIIENSENRLYGFGETVVKEGEEGDSLFIVVKGKLDVYIGSELVGTLREGDFFGEYSLLTGEKRKATVITDSEAVLLEIKKDTLAAIIKNTPMLIDNLLETIDKREKENISLLAEKRDRGEIIKSKESSLSYKFKKFFGLIND